MLHCNQLRNCSINHRFGHSRQTGAKVVLKAFVKTNFPYKKHYLVVLIAFKKPPSPPYKAGCIDSCFKYRFHTVPNRYLKHDSVHPDLYLHFGQPPGTKFNLGVD